MTERSRFAAVPAQAGKFDADCLFQFIRAACLTDEALAAVGSQPMRHKSDRRAPGDRQGVTGESPKR